MLYQSKGYYHVSCDYCPEVIDLDARDFSTAIDNMRGKGWKAAKDKSGAWEHACPGCRHLIEAS